MKTLYSAAELTLSGGRSQSIFPLEALGRELRWRNEAFIRGLCQNAYLGGNTALCRVLGRYKMFVDTTDVGLASHLLLEGYWEMWVTEAIASLVDEGMVVADIGANVGYFSLLMGTRVGAAGKVFAFEPNPRLVELLKRTLSINGEGARVSLHQLALGDEDGREMALYVPVGEPKNGQLIPADSGTPADAPRLTTARLDSRADWSEIEFAKIDVEGAEEIVWGGMQGLLDGPKLRTVVLEFTPGRYADAGAFLDRLTAPGFSLARIDFVKGIVATTAREILESPPADDIMLVLRR